MRTAIEAQEAAQIRQETGAETVIVLDNYSRHKSHLVRGKEKGASQLSDE